MDDILIQITGIILIDIPIVIYLVKRIMNNKNIPPKRKRVYIILTCIIPLFALLFYSMESNRRLKEKYSPKHQNGHFNNI